MKRFLFEVCAFLVVQASIAVGLEALYQRLLGANHYLAAFEDKSRLLEAAHPPRLLLVGGSSLAFGVNSATLERESGRPAVNVALNAGLGLDLILGPAERSLAAGDLVVLSLEYRLMEAAKTYDSVLVLQELRAAPSSARYLPASDLPVLLDDGLALPCQRLHALWDYARQGRPKSVYWRTSFNDRGDFVGHLDLGSFNGGGQHVWVPPPQMIGDACLRLSRFAEKARAVGARVVVVPPPIPADDFESQRDAAARFWEALARQTGLPVTTASSLDRSFFFDTAYHLTREGRKQRTLALVEALRPVLRSDGSEPLLAHQEAHQGLGPPHRARHALLPRRASSRPPWSRCTARAMRPSSTS
jgi:hypothetical protein